MEVLLEVAREKGRQGGDTAAAQERLKPPAPLLLWVMGTGWPVAPSEKPSGTQKAERV